MCEGQVSYSSELSLWVCNIFQISKPPYLKGNLIIIFGPTSACRDCRPTSALLLLLLLFSGMTRRFITRFMRLNILNKYNVSIIFVKNNTVRWYKIINNQNNQVDGTK